MSQRKWILSTLVLITSLQVSASNKVVYGEDNRKDVAQVSNPLFLKLASATAAMVKKSQIINEGSGFSLNFQETLETGNSNVCPSERFSQQPIGALCSGFLVGPDTLITAGHCFDLRMMGYSTPEAVCQSFSWVFNYSVNSSNRNPLKGFLPQDVYSCKKVIKTILSDSQDFAVIQLDRKVVGHEPLKFRSSGKIPDSAKLLVIGHPDGLPSKISDGGKILNNSGSTSFVTTLDTFHGNSGSAVFDATTGVIEGILIQGKTDYTPSSNGFMSCSVVNVCNEDGLNCVADPTNRNFREPKGETVLRITEATSYIPIAKVTTRRNQNRSK